VKKYKKTIKNSIFFSHITIIIISLLLTAIVFNLCLTVYIRKQTKTQLITAAGLVQKSLSLDMLDLNLRQDAKSDDREMMGTVLKVSRILKQADFFLDINYAFVGKDQKLIYALYSKEDFALLNQEILPALNKARKASPNLKQDKVLYFRASGKQYAAIISPLKLESGKTPIQLLIYSDLAKRDRLVMVVNAILFSILLITAIIAFILSNVLSKKISRPISQLSGFAKQIGERNYDALIEKYDDDEIGQLAETMKTMADELCAYDNKIKTFLQNASHELRTPLMSIQGYAEGIKYGVVDNQNGAVDIIIEESKRLSNLVEELLYLSKIDAIKDTMNFENISAEDLIRSCIEKVNGIAVNMKKNITFSNRDENVPLFADEEKLSRAVINVLANCLRYAKSFVEIVLEKRNNEVVIIIRDDGPGFEEKDLPNIFERFYKGKGGNYGLGLTISKTIIEKHLGSISAGNDAKGGACFNITIPAK